MEMFDVLVGLGSNRPFCGRSPAVLVQKAAKALSSVGGPVCLSPLYRSDAWPDPDGPAYVNAVAHVPTTEDPEAVLAALLSIEAGFGRRRAGQDRYAARSMDLDLLHHSGGALQKSDLTVPHPRMMERAFVLQPLLDVAPSWRHPLTGQSARAALAVLPKSSWAYRLPFTGAAVHHI